MTFRLKTISMPSVMQYLNQTNFVLFLWIVFFVTHSLFAAEGAKKILMHFVGKYYRLIYNIFAIIFFSYIYLKTLTLPHTPFAFYPQWVVYLNTLIKISAFAAFLYSLRFYNMAEFIGIEQILTHKKTANHEKLITSPLHKIVRHPWYLLALFIIWPGTNNNISFTVNTLFTTYLFIGARLEEQKLINQFEQEYLDYKKEVSGIIPIKYIIKRFFRR